MESRVAVLGPISGRVIIDRREHLEFLPVGLANLLYPNLSVCVCVCVAWFNWCKVCEIFRVASVNLVWIRI